MAMPATATPLGRELIHLILQFLNDEKYKETAIKLEQESAVFFNIKHFDEMILEGKWDEVERYLFGFSKIGDNRYTMKILFEIRKQKYFEALAKHDRGAACDVLVNDLRVFSSLNEELYKQLTHLITLDDFRQHDQLSRYGDDLQARSSLVGELKRLITSNPALRDKLQFPDIRNSRLRTLVNQSLNWQHSCCNNKKSNPEIKSLYADHNCDDQLPLPSSQLLRSNPNVQGPLSMNGHMPYVANNQLVPPGFVFNSPNRMTQQAPSPNGQVNLDASVPRLSKFPDKGIFNASSSSQGNSSNHKLIEEIPSIVARTLDQGSVTTSMDFHPHFYTTLLVGTKEGDISIWDVNYGEKLVTQHFKLWNMDKRSMILKAAFVKDPSVSVKRVKWYKDGSLFAVAYSKYVIQLSNYAGGAGIEPHREIEAHNGSVNDIAFCNPLDKLCLVSGGDDATIKVWEVATGTRVHIFQGHQAAIYSVCPHSRNDIHFVFSTSVDGKIKAWVYDSEAPMIDYESPNRSCAAIAYSTEGRRIFSCGTNKDGESHVVEWKEDEGSVKRMYKGLINRSLGVVKFDTVKDKLLACGDDFKIKFWDMNNFNLLIAIDADGGLPACPNLCFNGDGSLLSVTAKDKKIKILATVQSLQLLRDVALVTSQITPIPAKREDEFMMDLEETKPTITDMQVNKVKEIEKPNQLRLLNLETRLAKADTISKLTYSHLGSAVYALTCNASHLLWRWLRNETNLSGKVTTTERKVTTTVAPQFEVSGDKVTNNDLTGVNLEDAVHCFALSCNDSYLVSTSGGKTSLFNAFNFKSMTTFTAPPVTATCLAFYPKDNNVIAMAMNDFTIQIYNVRFEKVDFTLTGHSKSITALAFSPELNVLVSSADDQIIVWSSETWKKKSEVLLEIPAYCTRSSSKSTTQVCLYANPSKFLVVHESQLAVYATETLELLSKMVVRETSALISNAALSCDSQFIYCCFLDGFVKILDASIFKLKCQINPSVYVGLCKSGSVYPVVVAAHPQISNQLALGMSNGGVVVIEPLDSGANWGDS